MMDKRFSDKVESALSSSKGNKLYSGFLSFIKENKMEKYLASGCAVALSGGADSVFLLCLLWRYCKEQGLPLFAVTVEHGIRGEESKRDFAFSQKICEELSVPFFGREIDVPSYAGEKKIGMEEAARKLRYSEFDKIIKGRNDVSCIALAHNATDQVETVLMHLLRGSGTRGLIGIRPIREPFVRPILFCPAETIRSFLSENGIPYCIDSTNSDLTYTRNRVRVILPELSQISTRLEESVLRLSRNLFSDEEYFISLARSYVTDGFASRDRISHLHPSVLFRVILLLCDAVLPDYSYSSASLSAVVERLKLPGDFSVSLENGLRFTAKGNLCFVEENKPVVEISPYSIVLFRGENRIPGLADKIVLTDDEPKDINLLSFAVPASIVGSITLRMKEDGDAFVFASHTRKLKKLFTDLHISAAERKRIPIFCDEVGILYVPGFGFRDGIPKDVKPSFWITVYQEDSEDLPHILIPNRNIRSSAQKKIKKGTD